LINEWKQNMFSILKVILVVLAASGAATTGYVLYNDNSSGAATGWKTGGIHGAPGPIVGGGLPLAVAYGVYWLVRRRRKAD